ncbi:MAG: sensor histidine kinase [bacterium]
MDNKDTNQLPSIQDKTNIPCFSPIQPINNSSQPSFSDESPLFPLIFSNQEPKNMDQERVLSHEELVILNKELQKENLELVQVQEKLQLSLKEKGTLLKELHHRVKNNMQLISSLIRLEFRSITDKNITNIIAQLQRYIKSISLIHEKLYHAKDFINLDFNEYLHELTNSLLYSHRIDRNRIVLKIDLDQLNLKANLAIPFGLIISELISNSLKYAFPDNRQGKIKISLRIVENVLELIFADNGVGLPEDLDIKTVKTLGLQLVNIIVTDQLHGKITVDRQEGTCFKISFKINDTTPI